MEIVANNSLEHPPYLLITGESAEPATIPLEIDNSLFVGSGSNCRVILQGENVDPIHCMFWINEDRLLRVQDWNTEGRTLVNGQSVTTETTLNSGDKVEIAGYMIVPVLTEEDHQLIARHLFNSESDASQGTGTISNTDPPTMADESAVTDDFPAVNTSSQAEPQSPPLEAESISAETSNAETAGSELDDEVMTEPDASSSWEEELSSQFGFEPFNCDNLNEPGNSQAIDDSRDEELELLRMEVEQLRFELAERDEYQTASDCGTNWESEPNPVDDDQTLQLVNRLEELLAELQTSDARIRGLEELLQFSDQAAQAEQDERQQLESWVAEIEQRVSQREAESEAEMERVLNRLLEAKAQNQHLETQLKQVLQTKGNNLAEGSKELIQKSRNQIHDLQKRLEAANEENENLRRQSLCDESEVKAKEELQQMEQKLLEVQVETSRERAEMARKRAELENLKDELEQKLSSAKVADNADSRVKAMRQHLRDIHEEEKIEREEKRQRSLSGRISSLLSRVGR